MRRTRKPATATAGPRSDVPGIAREKLERKEGVFQIYFTGCGGDITMGKYNDASDKCREELAGRLLAGMEAAIAATKLAPAGPIRWRTCPVLLPPRTDPGFNLADSLARMKDPKTPSGLAAVCGRGAQWPSTSEAEQPIEFSSLEIGKIHIVNLPGEPLIDFQLFAQASSRPTSWPLPATAIAAPATSAPRQAFREGGYEPTDANVKPESEALVKKAIVTLLGVE